MRKQETRLTNNDVKFGIKAKIMTGFLVVLLLFMTSFFIILYVGNKNINYSSLVANDYLPVQVRIIDLQSAINKMNISFFDYVISNKESFKQTLASSQNDIDNIVTDVDTKNIFETKQEKLAWSKIINGLAMLRQKQNEIIQRIASEKLSNEAVGVLLVEQYTPLVIKLNNDINNESVNMNASNAGFFDLQTHVLHDGIMDLVEQTKFFQVVSIALILFSLILAVYISIYVSNKITRPLNKAINAARDIGSGQRNIDLHSSSKDETGVLIDSLSDMLAAITLGEKLLKEKKVEVTNASNDIVTTLEEVRHSVDIQSSGASEQASSINEITASLEEIEKSTAQTADKAKALGEAAIKTQEKGRLGVESVEESMRGMRLVREKVQTIAQTIMELSSQTQQVGEITEVVNNLAQQSKMLALNASIEAAKAGEAGKGFSVVASEVKNLAEQSEQSTSQVQKILEDIRKATERAVMVTEEGTKGVDYGASLIEKTGEIVISLNDVIREATIASKQIEAAISQESVGVEQITVGMNEINQVTASFVESARQTTEAIANLAEIAKDLKANIDSY